MSRSGMFDQPMYNLMLLIVSVSCSYRGPSQGQVQQCPDQVRQLPVFSWTNMLRSDGGVNITTNVHIRE